MTTWNFKATRNPDENFKTLEATFKSSDGFVVTNDNETNPSTFKIRKRIQDANKLLHLIVAGKLSTTNSKGETQVNISFILHFLTLLYIGIFVFFGLSTILLGIGKSPILFVLGAVLLTIGIAVWIDVWKKAKKTIQFYQTIITEKLEL